jgi:hypothetical protein
MKPGMRAAVVCAALLLATLDGEAREPGWHTMKAGIVGCQDRTEFDRLSSMRLSGDQEAFKKAAMQAILAGRCAIVAKGTEVYLEEVAMFAGMAKVRPRGEPKAYWIDSGYMD